jgi:hypothetical protein
MKPRFSNPLRSRCVLEECLCTKAPIRSVCSSQVPECRHSQDGIDDRQIVAKRLTRPGRVNHDHVVSRTDELGDLSLMRIALGYASFAVGVGQIALDPVGNRLPLCFASRKVSHRRLSAVCCRNPGKHLFHGVEVGRKPWSEELGGGHRRTLGDSLLIRHELNAESGAMQPRSMLGMLGALGSYGSLGRVRARSAGASSSYFQQR